MINFPQLVVNSLATGGLYLLAGAGLTLTYGLSRFPNFAYAEFVTLGALTGYLFLRHPGRPVVPALLCAFAASGLLSVAAYALVFRPLQATNAGPIHPRTSTRLAVSKEGPAKTSATPTRLGSTLEPEVYCDTVYDAVKLIALAAQKAGSEDPEKVRRALLEVGKNYQGASGAITFDSQGDRVGGTYEVWKVVKEGTEYKFVRVRPIPM